MKKSQGGGKYPTYPTYNIKRKTKLERSYLSLGTAFYCTLLKEDMWKDRSNGKTRKKKQTAIG